MTGGLTIEPKAVLANVSKLMPRLPFRAANAGVDGQDNHGHVGNERTLRRMRQTRQVLRRRRARAEAVQVLISRTAGS